MKEHCCCCLWWWPTRAVVLRLCGETRGLSCFDQTRASINAATVYVSSNKPPSWTCHLHDYNWVFFRRWFCREPWWQSSRCTHRSSSGAYWRERKGDGGLQVSSANAQFYLPTYKTFRNEITAKKAGSRGSERRVECVRGRFPPRSGSSGFSHVDPTEVSGGESWGPWGPSLVKSYKGSQMILHLGCREVKRSKLGCFDLAVFARAWWRYDTTAAACGRIPSRGVLATDYVQHSSNASSSLSRGVNQRRPSSAIVYRGDIAIELMTQSRGVSRIGGPQGSSIQHGDRFFLWIVNFGNAGDLFVVAPTTATVDYISSSIHAVAPLE